MGLSGREGHFGMMGLPGKHGNSKYHVLNEEYKIIQQAKNKYQSRLQHFSVRTEPDHGIFEPGQLILAYNFTLCNDGSLTQPPSACIELLNSDEILPFPQSIVLPAIDAGHSVCSQSGRLWAKIFDPFEYHPPDKPGIFRASTYLTAQVSISFFSFSYLFTKIKFHIFHFFIFLFIFFYFFLFFFWYFL